MVNELFVKLADVFDTILVASMQWLASWLFYFVTTGA